MKYFLASSRQYSDRENYLVGVIEKNADDVRCCLKVQLSRTQFVCVCVCVCAHFLALYCIIWDFLVINDGNMSASYSYRESA